MAAIGTQLKAARESLGITAAEASRRLHMRAMFVEALEREEWRTIGEPVYVRGFIRNYARMLGLDAGTIIQSFNECPYVEHSTATSDAALVVEQRPRFRYPWLLAGMSTLAALLVAKVVWTMAVPNAAGHEE